MSEVTEHTPSGVLYRNYLLPPDAPAVSQEYRSALENLVYFQRGGITQFYGGPLELDDDRDVWLSPVEIDDGKHASYFQLLYVNMRPEDLAGNTDVPVTLLDVDEAGHKLAQPDHRDYQQLAELFGDGQKHIVVRACTTGMAYYPQAITPEHSPELLTEHCAMLIDTIGIQQPSSVVTLTRPEEHDLRLPAFEDIRTLHARQYRFGRGVINSYGLVLDDDPWKYYELFSPKPVEEVSADELLVRVDSGCDIGQIFDDRGCDCREQLHTALAEIQELGDGVVLHIPSQDGRGFGAATKMETEGLKRGIEVATNPGDSTAYDTVTAARRLLGDTFDIRTYNGAGRILTAIGVRSVFLQTDNRLKIAGIENAGIAVKRKPTNTTASRGAAHHVAAKHAFSGIYFTSHE